MSFTVYNCINSSQLSAIKIGRIYKREGGSKYDIGPGYLTGHDFSDSRAVMHSEVSWPGESCSMRYPGQESHAQWGILASRVMLSEISWPGELCSVRYPSPESHAQWGILARGVMVTVLDAVLILMQHFAILTTSCIQVIVRLKSHLQIQSNW